MLWISHGLDISDYFIIGMIIVIIQNSCCDEIGYFFLKFKLCIVPVRIFVHPLLKYLVSTLFHRTCSTTLLSLSFSPSPNE